MCVDDSSSDRSHSLKTCCPDFITLSLCVCFQGTYKSRRRTSRSSASEASDAGEARAAVGQIIRVKVAEPQTPAEQKDSSSPDLHPEDSSSKIRETGMGQPDSVLPPSETGVIWPDFADSVLPASETGLSLPNFNESDLNYLPESSLLDFFFDRS